MKIVMTVGFAAAAIVLAPAANATNAYLGGLFGFVPDYSSMTGPKGQKCNTATTCQHIEWNNVTTSSAEAAITTWVAEHGNSGNVLWIMSASSPAATDYTNEHPEDRNTWIHLGPPDKPGNGNSYIRGGRVSTNVNADITFVTNALDPIARPNQPGTIASMHTGGYDNLDMRHPTTTRTISGTHTKDNVYGVAPAQASQTVQTSWHERRVERVAKRRAACQERREARAERRSERSAE